MYERTRDALVADWSGLTRDRKYGDGKLDDRPFIAIDTGGVSGLEEGLDVAMARQSFAAIEEADTILFLVDGQSGYLHRLADASLVGYRSIASKFLVYVT